jgi:phenylpropionate dioxygenase-like ring-hydroxylating dioxygenase large terminal subunit
MAHTHHIAGADYLDALVFPEAFPDRIHRRLFTDPVIFEAEMSKIFAGVWVYLTHESLIPNENDFVTTTNMGGRAIIVARGRDGAIQALFNRCTHRGATLCMAERGTAASFMCPYHGWTFRNDGALLGTPMIGGYGPSFDKTTRGLGRVPRVASYRGLVFGTLNPKMPSLADWLGPAAEYLDYFIDRAPSKQLDLSHGVVHWRYPGNWKLFWDNNADAYHVNLTHRSLQQMSTQRHGTGKSLTHFERGPDDTEMCVKYLGHGHKLIDQRPGMGSRWSRQRPVPGRETEAKRLIERLGAEAAETHLESAAYGGINLSLFPNVAISLSDVAINEPLSVGESVIHRFTTVPADAPEEVKRLRLRTGEDMPAFGSPDDVEMFARVQRGLTSCPEVEWVDMSRGIDREFIDTAGCPTGKVTDETGPRGAYAEWKRVMSDEIELTIA